MISLIQKIFRPKLENMNTIRISQTNLLYNIWYLQGLKPNDAMFPILKSNAYGHWLKEVVRILNQINVPYLVIDSLPEYFIARKHTSKHFLLIGETNPTNYTKINRNKVAITIYNISAIQYLLDTGKKFKIHIFLNTGMNREWIDEHDLGKFLEIVKKHKNWHLITIEWVMSHLASSEDIDPSVTNLQIANFKTMYQTITEYWYKIKRRHIGNSGAIFTVEDKFFNSWRTWLAFYGYNPLANNHAKFELANKLKPALEVYSSIVSVHDLEIWQWVSYNHTRTTHTNTKVVSIPFGYKEWLPRSASNAVSFAYKGQEIKQVWNICMNLCSAEIGNIEAKIWDEIQLVSSDPQSSNSMQKLAKVSSTIVRECLIRLDPSLHREIV